MGGVPLVLAQRAWAWRLSCFRLRLAELAHCGAGGTTPRHSWSSPSRRPARCRGAISYAFLAAIAGRRKEWHQALSHLDAITELDPDGDLALVASDVLLARALRAERSGSPEELIEALAPCLNTDDGLHLADQHMLLPNLVRAGAALGAPPHTDPHRPPCSRVQIVSGAAELPPLAGWTP